MTDLDAIRAGWDEAARTDAMYNIITIAEKANGGWTPEEFFAHGQLEIDAAMERINPLLRRKGRALDFGCGVGRLTQALARHFKRVDGVDISAEMVDRARSLNQYPGRVEYHTNRQRLPWRLNTFDAVFSVIVLQHMPTELQEGYVKEFVRVLKPGGIAMFQLPEGAGEGGEHWLSVWSTDRVTVEGWLADAGAEVIQTNLTCALGRGPQGWEYIVRKESK